MLFPSVVKVSPGCASQENPHGPVTPQPSLQSSFTDLLAGTFLISSVLPKSTPMVISLLPELVTVTAAADPVSKSKAAVDEARVLKVNIPFLQDLGTYRAHCASQTAPRNRAHAVSRWQSFWVSNDRTAHAKHIQSKQPALSIGLTDKGVKRWTRDRRCLYPTQTSRYDSDSAHA